MICATLANTQDSFLPVILSPELTIITTASAHYLDNNHSKEQGREHALNLIN